MATPQDTLAVELLLVDLDSEAASEACGNTAEAVS
jgi:hypothetical protein